MAADDFNAIKPVENLPNVTGLTPAGQRQGRKRRQNPPRRGRESVETRPDDAADGQTSKGDGDAHVIDYCA
jgi:hypothetical protein